nr:ribonuclease H-like domain-containing protein [Tanacetum cinerariifolium]
TVSKKNLVNVADISNLGLTVGHPNCTQALITKIRDLKINKNTTLYDVVVVPEYTISLLFVHKLSRDNKLFVGFNISNCYIQNLKANKIVGIGRQFNGLYKFKVDNACKIDSNSCTSTCFVSKTLWHQRLGYPANQVLDALKTSLNLDSHFTSDHLCDTCNKSKQTREPFPLSDHKSRKIDELVHLDVWGPHKINNRDGFRILSSLLSGKSPYCFVYGHDPLLSHFRFFGCLCYTTVLNNQDKFSNRFEKCVFIGYSNSKKGYKLLRLENKSIFYSKDVKFYDTVFLFIIQNNLKQTQVESGVTKDLNHKKLTMKTLRPNDEGRVSFNDDGTQLSPDVNQCNDDSEATSMDEINNTHTKGIVSNETDFINDFYENLKFNSDVVELPANTLRRSSRQTKLPTSLNDFIVEGKVKYGVERVFNYANLNHDNYSFIFALNKSVEPTCYEEAILDSNWIDAMNAKIEALNENHTWIIVDLPANRKAIGNMSIYKIKYKSSGDIDRYKARLVVKGFNKKEGIDFDETFSHVV